MTGERRVATTVPVGIESGGSRNWGAYISPGREMQPLGNLTQDMHLGGTRGRAEIRGALGMMFRAIRSGPGMRDRISVWLSAPGYARSTAPMYEAEIASAAKTEGVTGVACIANDATTLLLAPPLNGDGVIAIIGTGSVAIAAHGGDTRKYCGDEWVASDLGSGFELALLGIRAGYSDYQGWGEETALQASLIQWCTDLLGPDKLRLPSEITDLEARERVPYVLREVAAQGNSTKRLVARFAIEVLGAADRGDKVAEAIVRPAAWQMGDLLARLCQWREDRVPAAPEPHTVCIDGFIGGQPGYFDLLQASASKHAEGRRQIDLYRMGTARTEAGLGGAPVPPSLILADRVLKDDPLIRPVSDEFSFTRVELG